MTTGSAMSVSIRDYIVVFAVVCVLGLLFTPVSPFTLDILLVANISFALTILLVTFQTEKPLGFSTFPSVILLSTLLRLALNISATRLILEHGYAGHVIEGIGSYVIGGNYVTGIVVFFILVVIQYVVVTNGAQRVAEVAARFTLDSMPGKQMSIDADLNMGLVTPAEAKERRANIEREANFYGAMDGASKFVKGDAIAGILIIVINIVGGLAIAVAQKGMSWGDALHRYTLLTVGDGIVTQVPSLVIAVSTGIIITRATTDARLGHEIVRQVFSQYRSLAMVGAALLTALAFTSIPAVPLLLTATLFLAAAAWAWRHRYDDEGGFQSGNAPMAAQPAPENIARDEPLLLAFDPLLAQHFSASVPNLDAQLESLIKTAARDLGFTIPAIRTTTDATLASNSYQLRIRGTAVGRYTLSPNRLLAISTARGTAALDGTATREPTYGIPSWWIDADFRSTARDAHYTVVEPDMVLLTHVAELVRKNAAELLTRQSVEALVDARRHALGSLVDELVPAVLSWSDIQRVLQLLLAEQVSIANIDLILEVLVDRGRTVKSADDLAERVRERLGMAIAHRFLDNDGALHVISLAPGLERRLLPGADPGLAMTAGDNGKLFSAALDTVESCLAKDVHPVLLCTPSLRRPLRQLFAKTLPHIAVLSLNEIGNATQLVAAGVITIDSAANSVVHGNDTPGRLSTEPA